MENLYKVLQCNENASFDKLKKSYQQLALKYHPDKQHVDGDCSADLFVKVNRAWKILGDHNLRKQYDVRWKERCLTQTYPVQDTVSFEEFEEMEYLSEHETNTTSVDLHDGVNSKSIKTVTDRDEGSCSSKGDNSACDVFVSKGDNLTLKNSDSKGDNCTYEDFLYIYPCRCGGNHILTGVDVQLKFDIVCCDSCSLSIHVVYNDDNDDDDT